jgi:hypothetical protein
VLPFSQDFFQILRPGLQLLRPPKRDARDGPGVVAGFVAYNYDAFLAEYSIEPWQAGVLLTAHYTMQSACCAASAEALERSAMQWPDVLALMGDTSDNVPGLKGIGPKSALQLVQQFGSVERVLEHAAEVLLSLLQHLAPEEVRGMQEGGTVHPPR